MCRNTGDVETLKQLNTFFAPVKPWIEKEGANTSATSGIIEAQMHIDGRLLLA
jgi:hypothetical protein